MAAWPITAARTAASATKATACAVCFIVIVIPSNPRGGASKRSSFDTTGARRVAICPSLQEPGGQRTAAPSDRRNFDHDVRRDAFVGHAHMAAVHAVAVRHEQLRMVEWRALLGDARI